MDMNLEDIQIANTTAAFEPSLDYVVAKLPRFPFDKFTSASNRLGTQMKATGEVMGIGSNLEECLLKAVRSLEIGVNHIYMPKFDGKSAEELLSYVSEFRDDNLYAIAQLLRLGVSVDRIYEATEITPFFLESLKKIVDFERVVFRASHGRADPAPGEGAGLLRSLHRPAVERGRARGLESAHGARRDARLPHGGHLPHRRVHPLFLLQLLWREPVRRH